METFSMERAGFSFLHKDFPNAKLTRDLSNQNTNEADRIVPVRKQNFAGWKLIRLGTGAPVRLHYPLHHSVN